MVKSLYNCMAYAIRIVVDNTDECFFEKYLALTSQKSAEVNTVLSNYFPEIVKEGNAQEIYAPYLADAELVNRILKFIEHCININDMIPLVRFISKLDSALEQAVENEKVDSDEMYGLNTNSEEQEIQLLPRCISFWAHNNKDKNSSNTLNNFMNHLYYVDTRKLLTETGCTVSHRIFSIDNFGRAKERGYLNIGMSPLSGETQLSHEEKETKAEHDEFQVTALSNVDELVENVACILEKAKQEGVDILCFPEMLGHSKIIENMEEILQEFPDGEETQYPVNILKVTLLIVPSFSTGYYDFEANLRVCESFDCNVVWTNTCSAVPVSERETSDTVAFVLKTGKKTEIRNGLCRFKRKKCGGICRDCLYLQRIYFREKGCK